MALKYHPYKNSEDGAADMFRRVKLAYEVLGNNDTHFAYDTEQRRRGRSQVIYVPKLAWRQL